MRFKRKNIDKQHKKVYNSLVDKQMNSSLFPGIVSKAGTA